VNTVNFAAVRNLAYRFRRHGGEVATVLRRTTDRKNGKIEFAESGDTHSYGSSLPAKAAGSPNQ
jgi:hypothetical protein